MFTEFSNAHTLRRPLLRWLLLSLAVILIAVILISLYRNNEESPSRETAQEMKPDAPLLDQEQIRRQLEALAVQSLDAPTPPVQAEVQKQLDALATPSQNAVPPDQVEVRRQLDALSQTNR